MKTINYAKTLVFYDRVQVFAGQDAADGNYIGALIDAVGDADRYLVVATAPEPLRRFCVGELDLRTLLLESSASGWYTALVDDDFAQPVPLGACLRNNVLNDNRLDQGYYHDIPHIKAYYPRNRSKHDAISL